MPLFDETTFAPETSIGYLVRRAHQLGGALLEPLFAREGLTVTQWSALIAIWYGRGGDRPPNSRAISATIRAR